MPQIDALLRFVTDETAEPADHDAALADFLISITGDNLDLCRKPRDGRSSNILRQKEN